MPGANKVLGKLSTNYSNMQAPGSGKLSMCALLNQNSLYLTQEYINSGSQASACAHTDKFADTQAFPAAIHDAQNVSTSKVAQAQAAVLATGRCHLSAAAERLQKVRFTCKMAASWGLSPCPRRKSSLAFSMLPKSRSNIAHERCTYLDRGLTSSPCLNRYLTALLSPCANMLLSLCCHASSTAAVLSHIGSERRPSRFAVLCCAVLSSSAVQLIRRAFATDQQCAIHLWPIPL